MDASTDESLSLKEEEYKLLFSNMLNGYAFHKIVKDNRGRPCDYIFIEVNSAFEQMTGLKKENILGKKITAVIPGIEKDPVDWIGKYGEVALNDKKIQFESYSSMLDKWFHISAYCPKKGYFITVFDDITNEKKMIEEFKKTKLLLVSSIESQKDTLIFSLDKNYNYLYFNKAHQDAMKFAYNADITSGTNILTHISSDKDKIKAKINYDHALNGESHYNLEIFGDVNYAYYESYFNPIFNDAHEIIGCTGLARDITQRKLMEDNLQEQETMHKELINNMSSGMAIYSFDKDKQDFIIKDFNKSAEKIEKLKKEDVVGKKLLDLFPGVKEFGIYDAFKRVLTTGNPENFPLKSYSDNRISGWRENYIFRLPNKNIVTIYNDLTEQKKVEEIQKKVEEFNESIIQNTSDWIWEVNEQGKYTYCSEKSKNILGYSTNELLGKSPFDFMIKEEAERIEPIFHEIIKTKSNIIDLENWNLHKNGHKVCILTNGSPFFDEIGNFKGYRGADKDITERKISEENIIKSQKLLQNIINSLPIRIFWKDKNLKYIGCNTIFARDANKSKPEELVGKDDFQMTWKDQAEIYRTDDFQVINSGISKINFEEPQTTPNGNTIWLRTSKLPLTDLDGTTIGILGTYEDITNTKNSEEDLKKSKTALQTKVNELEKFNKITIDRELKMIELKAKIRELEEKLNKHI